MHCSLSQWFSTFSGCDIPPYSIYPKYSYLDWGPPQFVSQGSHTFFPMIFQNFSRTFPEYLLTQFPGPYIIIYTVIYNCRSAVFSGSFVSYFVYDFDIIFYKINSQKQCIDKNKKIKKSRTLQDLDQVFLYSKTFPALEIVFSNFKPFPEIS